MLLLLRWRCLIGRVTAIFIFTEFITKHVHLEIVGVLLLLLLCECVGQLCADGWIEIVGGSAVQKSWILYYTVVYEHSMHAT